MLYLSLTLLALLLLSLWIFLRKREARLYPDPESADELHWVRTQDGTRVALYRYRPRVAGRGEPVLCVHGLGANHRNLAFNEGHGVAQYLANRGYDVFAIDLRGRGMSDYPPGSWGFDDYVHYDLPAAIEHILRITGFQQLHWVGHSMGGMLFYAVAGKEEWGKRIASAVTLGSPVRFYHPRTLEIMGVKLYRYLLFLRYLAPRRLLILLSFLPWERFRSIRIFYNPRNTPPALMRWAARYALGTLAVRELYQFARWVVEHHLRSLDDRHDYRERIRTITVPTLVVAGSGDLLCPPYTIKPAFELLASREKVYVEAGIAQGFSADYGHIDLVFGTRARQEIFPLILTWIKEHPVKERAHVALAEEGLTRTQAG